MACAVSDGHFNRRAKHNSDCFRANLPSWRAVRLDRGRCSWRCKRTAGDHRFCPNGGGGPHPGFGGANTVFVDSTCATANHGAVSTAALFSHPLTEATENVSQVTNCALRIERSHRHAAAQEAARESSKGQSEYWSRCSALTSRIHARGRTDHLDTLRPLPTINVVPRHSRSAS